MLYLANWGSKQLAFRFPNGAIDEATLQPYYYGVDEIELRKAGDYLILTIASVFTARPCSSTTSRRVLAAAGPG
jgi:hypothetical protein